jgi:hypothetical protein
MEESEHRPLAGPWGTPSPIKNVISIIFWTIKQFIPITPAVLRAQPSEQDSAANRAETLQPLNPTKRPKIAWNTDRFEYLDRYV